MKIDYANVIKKSLKFSVKPKHWLPFFALNITLFSIFIAILFSNTEAFSVLQSLQEGTNTMPDYTQMMTIFQMLFVIFSITVIWQLVKLYVTGAVTYQSYKEKEYFKSWSVAASKYVILLLASIIVTILIGLCSLVPYIGQFLSIIVTLVFWFFIPAIIVSNLGPLDSLEKSYNIIRKEPFKVIAMWLTVVLVNFLLIVLFALPLILIFVKSYIPALISSEKAFDIINIFYSIRSNPMNMFIGAVIYTVGLSIAQAFSVKAVTEYYQKFKKKRFGIF